MIKVCVAGATGVAGRAIVAGILDASDLALTSAVARSAAGVDLGVALGDQQELGLIVVGSVSEALGGVDVLIDYTSHTVVKANAIAALERGVDVVIGASGLTGTDYVELDLAARRYERGVISAGNFSITAAMALAAAALVAPHLPQAEIIDYAGAMKPDVPSGTSRELAERITQIRSAVVGRPLSKIDGPLEARGVDVAGMRIHSVRLPSFSVSTEIVFGLLDERLTIRHDAGLSMRPYVFGTLLAVRRVRGRIGLTRGLDTLLLGVNA